ncbi:cupredoxin domain-containing protein [Streptomyces chartreusis]|uniref:cupredoxin domain-containing protein n=1 Tax=Streptomyces chartreusis TaxID=1969 RepID=UPI0033B2CB9D
MAYSVPHTVTTTKAPVKSDSRTLEQGDPWSYTFTKAGTYEYYCAVHPDMTGSVKVIEAGGTGSGGSGGSGGSDEQCASVQNVLLPILQHLYSAAAHLEESPGQQVTDLLNPDAYVKMHTVRAGQMLTPTTDFLTGTC